MNQYENILSVALGIHWAAVLTNKKILRIFNLEGIEVQMFGFHEPVLGMCFYENLLAVVYHSTHPFSGNQFAKVRIINLSSKEIMADSSIILSHDSKLRWFGFSEEGIFYVQDTKFMIWGQQSTDLWAPVYDGAKEANMWILGISDQSIICLKLGYGEHEPSVASTKIPFTVSFRPPFVSQEAPAKAAFLKNLKHDQESLRYSYFSHMKRSVYGEGLNVEDPMTVQRDTIKSTAEIEKLRVDADKEYIQLARLALLKDNHDAAIFYGLQLETPKTLETCLKMFESMGKSKVAQQLRVEADKLGNLQFKYRSGKETVYVPQVIYTQPEVNS